MKFRPITAIAYRYFSLLWHSPNRIMGLYIWMLTDMVLWGFFSTYLNREISPGFNALAALLGAVVLSNFFSRVMLNINMTFFEDMWTRNFLNLFASPMRISEYLLGLILCGSITSLFGLLLAYATTASLFGLSPLVYGTPLIPLVLILYLCGIALGIMGCAIVMRHGPSSEWFIWPIPAILSPFTGIYYPISSLPHWMQTVAAILPPSYTFEGLRAVVAGTPVSSHGLMLGFTLAFGYIGLACLFFMRTYRRVIRDGIIARYSAETAS